MRLLHSSLLVGCMLVAVPAWAQEPAAPPAPAPAPAAAPAPKTIVAQVRASMGEGNFKEAERLVLSSLADEGTTPEIIEALSWLGRGALAEKNYDVAQDYAARTYEMVDEQLMTRKLDDETHLPLALGASIEVQAQVLAADGNRSEAVLYLRKQLELYKDTSIVMRLTKNVNLLSLEGEPALPLEFTEWIGPKPPSMDELKGKPVLLFLWAHWCPDCKRMGPILDAAYNKYKSTGLTIVSPTQRFGYVAQRKAAPPDEELAYIIQIRDQFYPWMKTMAAPVSDAIYAAYGVSTTPTVVLVDREGKVVSYHPGQMTAEELDAALKSLTATSR